MRRLQVKHALVSAISYPYHTRMSEALQIERGEQGHFAPLYERHEIIDQIVYRLREGEPLAAICREPGMPSAHTVRLWMDQDEGAAHAIARARELGEEAIALEAQEIIDGLRPVPGVPPDASRDKARAEIRLKLLAKFNPKRWGDSQQLRHADANGEKLDTAPLVNELLATLGNTNGAPLTLINVTPGATDDTASAGYKPPEERITLRRRPVRASASSDVDDLV